ncbi:MAG TPA: sugar phosphate isomerase/epimerase family protein [Baekduia sp.]|nr:sugar phosphate isomerase/epimerase family protein [Baekduia sp.]
MKIEADELICAAYTIGGLRGQLSLEQRVAAAAEAGFRKVGMTDGQYDAERAAGRSDGEIRAILDKHGVHCVEVEFLYGWAGNGDGPGIPGVGKVDWRERLEVLLQLADVVGARHLNCGELGFYGPLLPADELAQRWGEICDRAAEHGLVCMLEFMASGELPDAASAWEVVRRAARDNGGVLVDAWHYFRGAADAERLRTVPGEAIKLVQINDGGPQEGDLPADTTSRRRVPGDGDFDLQGLLGILDQIGVEAPISVEIMSDELSQLAAVEQARRAREGALAVLRSTSSLG